MKFHVEIICIIISYRWTGVGQWRILQIHYHHIYVIGASTVLHLMSSFRLICSSWCGFHCKTSSGLHLGYCYLLFIRWGFRSLVFNAPKHLISVWLSNDEYLSTVPLSREQSRYFELSTKEHCLVLLFANFGLRSDELRLVANLIQIYANFS